MSKLYTRKEHLESYSKHLSSDGNDQEAARLADHRKYYAQFVNKTTISMVAELMGAERLVASPDPFFNDIPIREWDDIAPYLPREINFKDVGDYPTQAGLVCVAKEAARQYVEWRKEQS